MKNIFHLCFVVLLFACGSSTTTLELKEIKLTKRGGGIDIIKNLNALQNEKDTSKQLAITYTFNKRNVTALNSSILQIDKDACFSLSINNKLILERKNGWFFQDTLLSTKKDSFLYKSSGFVNYSLPSLVLKRNLKEGENKMLFRFTNQKHYKLNHSYTKLFLFDVASDVEKIYFTKNLDPTSLPWISIWPKAGIQDPSKSPAKVIIKCGETTVQEKIQIEIRGNTSQSFQKKSFSFFVSEKNAQHKKVALLNLPKHEHWILYGPYADKSLMRNVLAYSFWEQMGYYSPRTKFCELSINGFYQGVYVLCEKIRVDSNRLNLKNGYLLKIDRPKGDFFTSNISEENTPKTTFEIKYPFNKISVSEKNAIENYVHLFEESLFLSDAASVGIFEIIDISSFVDFLIVNELCKNIDAYRLSTYFQITENKKILMGPIWDFNFSFGLADYLNGYKTSGFVYDGVREVPFWWKKLMENIYFKAALKNRWGKLRRSIFSNRSIEELINLRSSELSIAAENNFDKWDLLGKDDVWPNYYIGDTHQEEIEYLRVWLLKRMQWLDTKWQN